MAVLDVARIFFATLMSLILRPQRAENRSRRSELFCRVAQRLLQESVNHPVSWLRTRQEVLKLYVPVMVKTRFEKTMIAGVPCQWCRIKQGSENTRPKPVIVYFHGGGYVIGSVSGYQSTLATLAVGANCDVLGVDYRLAPEHPLPAAQDDCLNVVLTLFKEAPERPIFLAGDSAGASLCIFTMMTLRQQPRNVNAAFLISPLTEPYSSESQRVDTKTPVLQEGPDDILNPQLVQHWFQLAAGDNFNEIRNKVHFANADFSELPPVYVQSAGAELLRPQIERFVERCKTQGVEVEYDCFDNQFHIFQMFAPIIPEAVTAMDRASEYFRAKIKEDKHV